MMAYDHLLSMGRLPEEVDGMDMEAYIGILRFRAEKEAARNMPETKYIDDFI